MPLPPGLLQSILNELLQKTEPADSQNVTGTVAITSATLATQATLASLLTELQGKADLGETQPVSIAAAVNPATAIGKTLTFVSVAQGGAGTTVLAAASVGNKHKLLGAALTMSILGTLKFTDDGGDLTGAMDIAATGDFVLPTSVLPYLQTGATNRALNIVTTLGAAKGFVVLVTEA